MKLGCARVLTGLLITSAIVLAGCQGDDGPATYQVKGKVTYKGTGAPVTAGTVLFESTADSKIQASGDIQPDGTFELGSNLGKPGTVEGEHRVLVEPPRPEYGEKAAVANKYARFESSNLKATVKPDNSNTVTIEIEK